MLRPSVFAVLSAFVFCSQAFAGLNPQDVASFQRLTRGGTLVCRSKQAQDTPLTLKKFGNFNISLKNGAPVIVGNAGDSDVLDLHMGGDFMFIEIGGSTGSTQFGVAMRTLNLNGVVAGTITEYDDDSSTMTKQIFCIVR
jgi:hypothetical protein